MANQAIETRRAQLVAEGKDPGANYGGETKQGPNTIQLTDYGMFVAQPGVTSAWFFPDAGALSRFR